MTRRRPSNRRLLVISYHFPPDGSIGGQRWAGLSKYLARAGWEVHVVTAAAPARTPIPTGVHRHFVPRRRTLNEWYRARIAARVAQQDVAGNPASEHSSEQRGPLGRAFILARRIVGSAIGLPDQGRGWIMGATRAALRLAARHDFDCVISSGPPHSAHIAGLIATLGRQTDFWIDMRDPWAMTHKMNDEPDSFVRAERRALHALERLIFPHASRVLVNTSEFATALRAEQPDLNVAHFPNGIDTELLPARDAARVSRGSIAYVGTLYAGRDLSSVLTAMRRLADDRSGEAGSVALSVAGPLESPHSERMRLQIETCGLTESVHVLGTVPRDAALDLLSRSHLALVLAQDQPMCVPAKLYESVGLGVPTLVLAEKDSAAACEARRIGAMTVEGDDVAGITAVLTDLLTGRIPLAVEAKTAISYASLSVEMDRLLCQATLQPRPETAAPPDSLPHPVS